MTRRTRQTELDGLSLIGLGRVPACAECPRYRDLVARYMSSSRSKTALAAVPATCEHLYCAPLAERYGKEPPAVLQQAAS